MQNALFSYVHLNFCNSIAHRGGVLVALMLINGTIPIQINTLWRPRSMSMNDGPFCDELKEEEEYEST